MRVTNILVFAFLCLATVAAFITPLKSRDDVLATFTYEALILSPTRVSCTDQLAIGGARSLHPG